MIENNVEELVSKTLLKCADAYKKEENPALRKTIDDYAMQVIDENIPDLGARKDFRIDYIIYKRAEFR